MLQVHSDDSFLRFIRAVGQPTASRSLIGPPMSEAEAAAVTAGAPA